MLAFICDKVLGPRMITYNGHEINLNPPWKRIDLRLALIETTGIDLALYPTDESLAEAMRAARDEVQTRHGTR